MRQWEIQLAEKLEKHKDCKIFCECLEQATRKFHSKADAIDMNNFTQSDWDNLIQECLNEILQETNDNL